MPGMRNEIRKEETYNKYGGDVSIIEIWGYWETWNFRAAAILGDSGRESLIEGRLVCAVGNKPLSAGHAKTCTYVDENRKLDAIFCVKGSQEFVETNASAPPVQLQSVRLFLAVIGYRKWNFGEMGVLIAFLRPCPLKRDTYAKLPDGVEKDNVAPPTPNWGVVANTKLPKTKDKPRNPTEREGTLKFSQPALEPPRHFGGFIPNFPIFLAPDTPLPQHPNGAGGKYETTE